MARTPRCDELADRIKKQPWMDGGLVRISLPSAELWISVQALQWLRLLVNLT